MNPTSKPIPQLNTKEKALLNKFFYLPGWQFEAVIGRQCTEIDDEIITWEGSRAISVKLYGLNAVRGDEQKPCIATLFIVSNSRVYQVRNIEQASEMYQLLRKQFKVEKYERQVQMVKYEERKKRVKMRKLSSSTIKNA